MPLMTTKPMFDLAYDGGFAIGAFNVNNMEITQGIITACAAEKAPLILQISKGARKYANMRYLKHIIDAAVEENPGPPHLRPSGPRRHGRTGRSLHQGRFHQRDDRWLSSAFEENVKLSAAVVKAAHQAGVVVEAELGMLGGIEEHVVGASAEEYEKNVEKYLTDP